MLIKIERRTCPGVNPGYFIGMGRTSHILCTLGFTVRMLVFMFIWGFTIGSASMSPIAKRCGSDPAESDDHCCVAKPTRIKLDFGLSGCTTTYKNNFCTGMCGNLYFPKGSWKRINFCSICVPKDLKKVLLSAACSHFGKTIVKSKNVTIIESCDCKRVSCDP